ncbi:MAG: sulfatase-like hydrolase/transferase [Verrucomicrobia bacterium]|nr:sulfatase-like hydrolase/transferase [Verrucomicrobiota bacterium]
MKRMFTLLASLLLTPLAALNAADRPNIIVILADDYGYGSAGCCGADPALVRTPNIDRLAKEGRRFTDANTTSSVCSPTRYSVVTGRYCWRTPLKHEVLSTFAPLHIETTRLTVASLLKKHGYATAAVGKWHLGYGTADDSPRWRTDYTAELSPGPLDIGFEYHFSVPSNHGDVAGVFVENRFVYGLRSGKIPAGMKIAGPVPDSDDFQATYTAADMENAKNGVKILDLDAPRRKNERVMKVLTDKATAWLERQPKEKPFFLYFTPVAVHNPITPDKDLAGRSKAGLYGDWIHELDRSVGRILDTLDRTGAAQNTLVIFSSDNGGVFKPERDSLQTAAFKAGLRVNGDLRGGKHDVWEGGFKVPFLVRWPGKAEAGSVCRQMISLADILATTAAIVGEPLPEASKAAEDSRSFLPAILGEPARPVRDDIIVHSAPGVFAIRKGPWKWIEGVPVDEIKPGARKTQAAQFHPQLYNTHDDPAETKDVSAQHPEVVAELRALLNRYRDGGYSRELPPAGVKPAVTKVVSLPPLTGTVALNEPLAALPAKPWIALGGEWQAKDGGLWGMPKASQDQPAALRAPLVLTDGAIEYEVNFRGANRVSLRVEWGDRKGSFRLVISRTSLELAKNPSQGEAKDALEPLARKALKLDSNQWYPVRITFKGNEATVQVNDVVAKGTHAVLGQSKTGMNFLVFGQTAAFRNVKATKN